MVAKIAKNKTTAMAMKTKTYCKTQAINAFRSESLNAN